MLSVKDIAARLGLSEWGARRLLYACKPLLHGMHGYGSHGEWLISPQAISLLERARELRAQGIRLQDLCSRLASEMELSTNGSPADPLQARASREQSSEQGDLIAALREQIELLKSENAWLRAKLDETLSRLPALPPAPKLSRWQALKIAILGR